MGHRANSKTFLCHHYCRVLQIKFQCKKEHGNNWFKKENELTQKLAHFQNAAVRLLFRWHLNIFLLKITFRREVTYSKREVTQRVSPIIPLLPSLGNFSTLPWAFSSPFASDICRRVGSAFSTETFFSDYLKKIALCTQNGH